MHIHLDTLGGISGNMFIAAILDAWPDLEDQLAPQIEAAGFGKLVTLENTAKNDGTFQGAYFSVQATGPEPVHGTDAHSHHYSHTPLRHTHLHRAWSEIRQTINNGGLETRVKQNALGIFQLLAEAEAHIHGKDVDEVAFHEVGAWDSIADIVCAAYLIDRVKASSWSVSSLPLARGTISGAHGTMPLPAPAVTQLLKGWVFHDDGLEGERITPTGAAILKFLAPTQESTCKSLRLSYTGLGFGSRSFKNTSNVLRLMAFDDEQNAVEWREEKIVQINFEIDDQTSEDLSVALDALRREPGVLDVSLWSAIGKKGRQFMAVQILTEDAHLNATIRQCFLQTTTIGLRYNTVHRACLPRRLSRKEYSNSDSASRKAIDFGIKETTRPGQQISLKAEMDDIKLSTTDRMERQKLRSWLEQDSEFPDHSGPNPNQRKK